MTLPTILREADRARSEYHVDTALGDAVAIVRVFLGERLGIGLGDEATLDRLDEAARHLLAARGPVASADLVTVLAGFIVALLADTAGPNGDLDAAFDMRVLAQVEWARVVRAREL